jgi:hypothetical protein
VCDAALLLTLQVIVVPSTLGSNSPLHAVDEGTPHSDISETTCPMARHHIPENVELPLLLININF